MSKPSSTAPPAGTARRLLVAATRPAGGWASTAAVTSVLAVGCQLALPVAIGRAVDATLGAGDRWSGLQGWLGLALALVAVLLCCSVAGDVAAGYTVAAATARLRIRLIGHVVTLEPRTARCLEAGDLVSRLVHGTADAGQAGTAAISALTALLLPAGSLVALALVDPWLAVAFAGGLLTVGVVLRAFVRDTSELVTRYQAVQGVLSSRLAEALAGARTIAAAGIADQEAKRVLTPLPRMHQYGADLWAALGRAAARGALVGPVLHVGVLAVGGLLLSGGRISPGGLIAASQYAVLGSGMGPLVGAVSGLAVARGAAWRLTEVLSSPRTPYGGRTLPPGPGHLRLRGVTVFGLESGPTDGPTDGPPDPRPGGLRGVGETVLDDVDLSVPGGCAAAVVGHSGAGKSALAAVAARLLDPDAGEVLLDGVPLRDLDRDVLRTHVRVAFERPVLVGETIGDAIGLGPAAPTAALVRNAAAAAQVDGVVDRLPAGFATRLADAPLSGGELQRIGLARAWPAERLLVLDDATSSLDTVTEMQVGRMLTTDRRRRTRLIVTHRVTTAARSDLVVWLDGGRVRGLGTHRSLWRNPAYRAVFGGSDADRDRP